MSTRSRVVMVSLHMMGCMSSVSEQSHLGERMRGLASEMRDELRAKEERHRIREYLRGAGKRVCEEGEWPQRWREDCNMCTCDVGDVRMCTKLHCHNRGKRLPQKLEEAMSTTGPNGD